jgi:UDP-GlcNAc:undecaprenyl-phosphate GlcNAc-1-phosphate transferase
VLLFGPLAASFLLCLLAILALRPLAFAVDLVDKPGGHKTHVGDVPVVGGLAMLIGLVFGIGLAPLPDANAFLAGASLLVVVGMLDDRFHLSPWTRLGVHAAAATLVVVATDSVVWSFGDAFGTGDVTLEAFAAHVFTVLAVIAAVNAFNMIDGVDGLAGATSLVALLALALLAQDGGMTNALFTALVVVGVVAAFLATNLPVIWNRSVRTFMGDAGSALVGLCVAWLAIDVSQHPRATVAPVTVLWVMALPLYEMFWSVTRRVMNGHSPLRSDTGHLHHLLLAAGFGPRDTFIVFATLATLLAGLGIGLDALGVPEAWSFGLLVVAGVAVVTFCCNARAARSLLPLRAARPAVDARIGVRD